MVDPELKKVMDGKLLRDKNRQSLVENFYECDKPSTTDYELWYKNEVNVWLNQDGTYTITLDILYDE